MRNYMLGLAVATVWLVGCSEYAAGVCCTSEADCNNLGIVELRGCQMGQACSNNHCINAQCTTSLDCSEVTPICAAGLCLAACSEDADCALTEGKSYCGSGRCVACVDNLQCGGNQPFCDVSTSECRGCAQDSECGEGVCRTAEATCVAVEDVVYVTQNGNDSGPCTKFSPCGSLPVALLHLDSQRNTIRIVGPSLAIGPVAVHINVAVYIKGDSTRVAGPSTPPEVTVDVASTIGVSIEGLDLRHPLSQALNVDAGARVHVLSSTVEGAYVRGGGVLTASDVEFVNNDPDSSSSLVCRDSTLNITSSRFYGGDLYATDCMTSVSSSRFENRASLFLYRGISTIQNNILIAENAPLPLMTVDFPAGITRIYHNTLVDVIGTSPVSSLFFSCRGDADVSNNIFVARSRDPFVVDPDRRCAIRHSLFDDLIDPGLATGEGNRIAPFATVFANLANQRFEPAPDSQARGAGEDLGIQQDFAGGRRPMPTGSAPDVGAYEVP